MTPARTVTKSESTKFSKLRFRRHRSLLQSTTMKRVVDRTTTDSGGHRHVEGVPMQATLQQQAIDIIATLVVQSGKPGLPPNLIQTRPIGATDGSPRLYLSGGSLQILPTCVHEATD